MNRVKRILTRGWLGNALSVLTFGYYPARVGTPIAKITFAFVKRSMTFELEQRSMTFALENRTMAFGLTSRTMGFELMQRSITFDFIGNEPG